MPIVKHLNHLVYFIKKEIQGEQLLCNSQTRDEFDLAIHKIKWLYLSRNSFAGRLKVLMADEFLVGLQSQ